MELFVKTILIFISLFQFVIIIDIILSFFHPLLASFRQNVSGAILDPFYSGLRKVVKLQFWPFDLAPMVLFIISQLIGNLIIRMTGINLI